MLRSAGANHSWHALIDVGVPGPSPMPRMTRPAISVVKLADTRTGNCASDHMTSSTAMIDRGLKRGAAKSATRTPVTA